MTEIKGTVLGADQLTPDMIKLWQRFCRASPIYHSPFYWPQFTRAVASVRYDVKIAVFEERGDIVGFLPFHETSGGTGKPVGGQLNDYQGPILANTQRLNADSLLDATGLSTYDYNHLPKVFVDLSKDAHSASISPQMDLSDGYDALIERKGKSLIKARKDIERCHRKTERDIGPIRFTFNNLSDADFRRHVEMKNEQLSLIGTSTRIGKNWLGKVLENLRLIDGPEFSSVLTTLHAGDKLIAAHYGLRTSNVLHWWFPSYDLAARNLGPGINLLDHCAKAAAKAGITTIDFGRGAGGYKLKFADKEVPLCEGTISRPNSFARLIRQGAQSVVSTAERLPLGRYGSYPRKAAQKFIYGVALSDNVRSPHDRAAR